MSKSIRKSQQTKSRPETLSDIVGLEVFTSTGTRLGRVNDIRVDFSDTQASGIALTDVNPQLDEQFNSDTGIIIPYGWVRAVHDVVIVLNLFERLDVQ